MAKLREKNVLDYRSGGDTIDDFAQKYMAEMQRLYVYLNELRTHAASTEAPEAYQFKVEGGRFFIRDGEDVDWVYLFDVARHGGFHTDTIGQISSGDERMRPAAGGAYDLYLATDTRRFFLWRDGAWRLLYSLQAKDLVGYNDLVRQSADVVTPTNTTMLCTESQKLVRTNSAGVLPVNISGTADKVGGQPFVFTRLADGQIPVYRESLGKFVNENKEAVGSGKALTIRQGKTILAVYDGNTAAEADLARTYGGYWTAKTEVAEGECVRLMTLPQFYLECKVAGTTGEKNIESAINDERLKQSDEVTDGSVVWKIWRLQLKNDVAGEAAAAKEAQHAKEADAAESAKEAVHAKAAETAKEAAHAKAADEAARAREAEKLSAARQITLTGDVTGGTSFDGTGDVTLSATVKDKPLPYMRQPKHTYLLSDLVRTEEIPSYLHLECMQAGITAAGGIGTHKTPGETFMDGTVKWQVVDDRVSVRLNTLGGIAELIYPVGSIYMSIAPTNPALLFGGTWEILSNRFLVGAGSKYPPGAQGGEEEHQLTMDEMPSHSHSGSTSSAGSHSHTIASVSATYSGSQKVAQPTTGRRTMYGGYLGDAGNHTHSLSIGSAGGNAAHNNLPPYLAVYMWKRTA